TKANKKSPRWGRGPSDHERDSKPSLGPGPTDHERDSKPSLGRGPSDHQRDSKPSLGPGPSDHETTSRRVCGGRLKATETEGFRALVTPDYAAYSRRPSPRARGRDPPRDRKS